MKFFIISIEDITQEQIDEVARRLPNRFAQSQKFKFESDSLRCLGVGVLLLNAFPTLCESELKKNQNGKLFIEGREEFNVSHGGKYVVLVTDKNPVGIDIEEMRERSFIVATKVFTKDEQQWMSEDKLRRFFYLWTQKESLVKAEGCGITIPLESFSVLPFEKGDSVVLNGKNWWCTTKEIENYVVSVCSTSREVDFTL